MYREGSLHNGAHREALNGGRHAIFDASSLQWEKQNSTDYYCRCIPKYTLLYTLQHPATTAQISIFPERSRQINRSTSQQTERQPTLIIDVPVSQAD